MSKASLQTICQQELTNLLEVSKKLFTPGTKMISMSKNLKFVNLSNSTNLEELLAKLENINANIKNYKNSQLLEILTQLSTNLSRIIKIIDQTDDTEQLFDLSSFTNIFSLLIRDVNLEFGRVAPDYFRTTKANILQTLVNITGSISDLMWAKNVEAALDASERLVDLSLAIQATDADPNATFKAGINQTINSVRNATFKILLETPDSASKKVNLLRLDLISLKNSLEEHKWSRTTPKINSRGIGKIDEAIFTQLESIHAKLKTSLLSNKEIDLEKFTKILNHISELTYCLLDPEAVKKSNSFDAFTKHCSDFLIEITAYDLYPKVNIHKELCLLQLTCAERFASDFRAIAVTAGSPSIDYMHDNAYFLILNSAINKAGNNELLADALKGLRELIRDARGTFDYSNLPKDFYNYYPNLMAKASIMVDVINNPNSTYLEKSQAILDFELAAKQSTNWNDIAKGVIAVIIAGVITVAFAAGLGVAGTAAGLWSGPGAFFTALAGGWQGTITGWAIGVTAASAITGIAAGAISSFAFFKATPIQKQVNEITKAAREIIGPDPNVGSNPVSAPVVAH